jgi:hypothetical protein
MDASKNFVIQGNPDAQAGIQDVLFTPLLRATVKDVAGSISGTVSGPDGPVAGAQVEAELENSGDLEPWQTTTGTGPTQADGTYRIWFLSPGTYTVSVDLSGSDYDGFGTVPSTRTVTLGNGEAATGIDFTVEDP